MRQPVVALFTEHVVAPPQEKAVTGHPRLRVYQSTGPLRFVVNCGMIRQMSDTLQGVVVMRESLATRLLEFHASRPQTEVHRTFA
jgi:hypothetical protein